MPRGVFAVLNESSDDDDDDDSKDSQSSEHSAKEQMILNEKYAEVTTTEEGWELVRRQTSANCDESEVDDEKNVCLICQRGSFRKIKDGHIPCKAKCNQSVSVHGSCLLRWRMTNNSCPLCRGELEPAESNGVSKLPASSARGRDDDVNDSFDFEFVELDVKAKRRSSVQRNGKPMTYRAVQQRTYAMGKRDAQRATAKGVTFAEDFEDYAKSED